MKRESIRQPASPSPVKGDTRPESSKQEPILEELARLRFEAERARSESDYLSSRRVVRVATTLADAVRSPRELLRLPRHLRRTIEGTQSRAMRPNVDRLLRSLSDEDQVLGLDTGLRHPYAHLRVLHIGHQATFSRVAPHVSFDPLQFPRDLESHLDLAIVEPPMAAITSGQVQTAIRACRLAGVPVVVKATRGSDLNLVPVEGADLVITSAVDVAEAAAQRVGRDRVLHALPSVEIAAFNPMGWLRKARYPVGVNVGEIGGDESDGPLSEVLTALGSQARVLSNRIIASGSSRADLMREDRVALVVPHTFARPEECLARIMENLACGTPVIVLGDVPNPELSELSLVRAASTMKEAVDHIDDLASNAETRERTSVPLRRQVLRGHSHPKLFEALLARLDIPVRAPAKLSVLLSTRRPDRLEQAAGEVARQTYPDVELVLILHGSGWDAARAGATARSMGLATRVVTAAESWTLGDCLNAGLDVASGELVAKMDDDDYYGPEHLTDVALALDYADADLVGKRGHFVHLRERDLTLEVWPDEQERFVDRLAGGTILLKRRTLERYRFRRVPHGVDTHLIMSLRTCGGRVYAANRFNYIRERQRDGHTFERVDEHFIEVSESQWPGLVRSATEF